MKFVLCAVSVALIACMAATISVAQTPKENAWTTLNNGLTNQGWEKRAKALGVLGELAGDKQAEAAAIKALKDDRSEVRVAAAQALGDMGAKSAVRC